MVSVIMKNKRHDMSMQEVTQWWRQRQVEHSPCQGSPKATRCQKLQRRLLPKKTGQPSEGVQPAGISTLDFWHLECKAVVCTHWSLEYLSLRDNHINIQTNRAKTYDNPTPISDCTPCAQLTLVLIQCLSSNRRGTLPFLCGKYCGQHLACYVASLGQFSSKVPMDSQGLQYVLRLVTSSLATLLQEEETDGDKHHFHGTIFFFLEEILKDCYAENFFQ